MKHTKLFCIWSIIVLSFAPNYLYSQSSSASNTQTTLLQFLGWNIGGGINGPLNIKTEGDLPISFYTLSGASTLNNQRMFINQSTSSGAFGGYVGIGTGFLPNSTSEPLARLHLGSPETNYATDGWRAWMKEGTFIHDASDIMYIGLNNLGGDRNDAIISWGDNIGPAIPANADFLRFIFTEATAGTVGNGPNGLEVMRFVPDGRAGLGISFLPNALPGARLDILESGNSPSVPVNLVNIPQLRLSQTIGAVFTDFRTDGAGLLTIKPTGDYVGIGLTALTPVRTLDVFGRARIRNMTLDNSMTEVVVRDPANGDLYINNTIGAANDWHITGNTGINNLTNYLGTNDGADVIFKTATVERARIIGTTNIPVYAGNIGIGISAPTAKLHSQYTYVNILNSPNTNGKFVLQGSYNPPIPLVFTAVEGTCTETNTSTNITKNIGGDFVANNGTENIGVSGTTAGINNTLSKQWAVYGNAGGSGANYWAGYFNGYVFSTQSYVVSDVNLKTDIQDYSEGLTIINKLLPKTYEFKTTNDLGLNLPSGKKVGLIAQDVQLYLPDLVTEANQPSTFDTSGNLIIKGDSFMVLNYIGMVPILVSALQELSQQVTDLETRLDSCCSASKGMRSSNDGGNYNDQTIELENVQTNFLGQSVPNPHSSQCTIPYRIALTVIKAEIIFSDQLGSEISRVEIVTRGAGQLTVLSSRLEDGLYSYTLITDGKLIDTKKMVKQH